MTAVALILVGAAVAHALALRLAMPAIPLLVLTGILLRQTGLLQDTEMLNSMLLLGVTVLVFMAGTELDPRRFSRQGSASVLVGLLQFAVLGAAGFGIATLWDLPLQQAAYIALATAASSTFVVVRILKRTRRFYEPFGKLVLGVLLVQDVLVILAVSALVQWNSGLAAVESALLRSGVLLVAAWICARTVVPWLLVRLKLDDEAILIVVLGILFAFLGAAHYMDVPMIAGAFAAGFAVSSFPVNAVIRGQLRSLSDFFIAIFLVALGAMLVLPDGQNLLLALCLAAAVLLVTPPLVALVAERAGLTSRSAIESGLILAQTSELSLVIMLLGAEQGHVGEGLLAAIAMVTVFTMVLTPFLATDANAWRLVRLHRSRFGRNPDARGRSGHVVLLGCGVNTEQLVLDLLRSGHEVVVVDDDPAVDEWVNEVGGVPLRGDALDPQVLSRASVGQARVVISTLRRQSDNCRIIRQAGGTPVLVRVFEDVDADAIEEAGGIAVRYSDAAAEEFLAWFAEDEKEDTSPERPQHPGHVDP